MSAPGDHAELEHLLDKDVVFDSRGEFLYIGKLVKIGEWFFTITEADVHDVQASRTSKEVYLIEAAKFGIKKNRHNVLVRKSDVLSISLLEDVIKY